MATLQAGIDARGAKSGAREFTSATDKMKAGAKSAGKETERLGKKVTATGKAASSAKKFIIGLFGGLAAAAAVRGATRTIAGFEETLLTLKAVAIDVKQPLDAQESQFRALESAARDLGATTRFSANEAAEGLLFLARAGFTVEEAITAVPATLDLATAGALGLGEAADIASNILSAFNLQANETARVADVLANTANRANTDVRQLAEAMKFAAPVAGALGLDVEETAAAIGALGDSGIQASLAGTNLRGILGGLLGPTGAAKDAIKDLGLSLDDVNPENRNLSQIFRTLADANLDAASAVEIFGRRNAAAALVLTSSIDKVEALSQANREAEGTSKRVTEEINKGLVGSFKNLRSAVEEGVLQLGDAGFTGALKAVVDTSTGAIRLLLGIADAETQADGASRALAKTVKFLTLLLSGLVAIKIVLFLKSMTVAAGGAAAAFAALNAVIAANPFVAAAIAVVTLASAVIAFTGNMEQSGREVKQFKQELAGLADLEPRIDALSKLQIKAVEKGDSDLAVKALREEVKLLEDALTQVQQKGDGVRVSVGELDKIVFTGLGGSVADLIDLLEPADRGIGFLTQTVTKFNEETQKFEVFTPDKTISQASALNILRAAIEGMTAKLGDFDDAADKAEESVKKAVATKDAEAGIRSLIETLENEAAIIDENAVKRAGIVAGRRADAIIAKEEADAAKETTKALKDEAVQLAESNAQRIADKQAREDAIRTLQDAKNNFMLFNEILREETELSKLSSNEAEVQRNAITARNLALAAGIPFVEAYVLSVENLTREQQANAKAAAEATENENRLTQERDNAEGTLQSMVDGLEREVALLGLSGIERRQRAFELAAEAAITAGLGDKVKELATEYAELLEKLGEGNAEISKTGDLFDAARAAGADAGKAIREVFGAAEVEIGGVNSVLTNIAEEVGPRVGAVFTDAFFDLITGARDAREVIGDLIKSIGELVLKIIIAQTIGAAIGGFTTGILGGGVASAQGNVFSNNRLVPFQQGGLPDIITQPTVFPLAGGNLGIAGEAGPETAIAPLARTTSGDLGVKIVEDERQTQGAVALTMVFNGPTDEGRVRRSARQAAQHFRRATNV